MAYAKAFSITQPGTTGQVTYGGPGANVNIGISDSDTPMVLFLHCVARAADGGGSAHAVESFGWATDRGGTAAQRYISFASEDNIGTSDVYPGHGIADILKLTDGTAATVDFEVAFVSMQTGSFTLDWQNLHTTASINVYGWVWTDSLVADALAGSFTIDGTGAATQDITVVAGFGQPHWVGFMISWNGTDPPSTEHGDTSFGFGVKQASANGRCLRWGSNDSAANAATHQAAYNDSVVSVGYGGILDLRGGLSADSAWPTDGFEFNRVTSTANGYPLPYLAVKFQTGVTVTHGEAAMPTTNGQTNTLTSADSPTFAMGLYARTATANTIDSTSTDAAMWGMGIADSAAQLTMGGYDDDAPTTMVAGTFQNDGEFVETWLPSSNTKDGAATIAPSGSNFVVTYGDAPPLAARLEWFTLGVPGAVPAELPNLVMAPSIPA